MDEKIGIWRLGGKERSNKIAEALMAGARAAGLSPIVRMDRQYSEPRERIAAFYGYQGQCPQIMHDYVAAGRKVVFIDLGYWHRRQGGRWDGYHKVSINARHPTAYLMDKPRPMDRMREFGLSVKPWRKDGHFIMLAGMSAKSAESYGFGPEEWEKWAVGEIRKHTSRPIVYRPKPSWTGARPFAHVPMAPASELRHALVNCYAVVTHHSNVAIDAIMEGVPAFCMDGAAVPFSSQDLSRIEKPERPEGREQWVANLAYCQWSTQEMRSGAMWRFLVDDGLI